MFVDDCIVPTGAGPDAGCSADQPLLPAKVFRGPKSKAMRRGSGLGSDFGIGAESLAGGGTGPGSDAVDVGTSSENDCEVGSGFCPCSDNGSNANNSVSEVGACLGSTSESNASSLDAGFDICCLGTQNTINSDFSVSNAGAENDSEIFDNDSW